MRFVVLDLETTGLNRTGDVSMNHRIIEIACVEIIDNIITGKEYQSYVNPERDITKQATKIHGITNDAVGKAVKFKDIATDVLEFIGKDSTIVIHNAKFDTSFLDLEFNLLDEKLQPQGIFPVVDTLEIARHNFPFEPCTLDNLSKIFDVKIERVKHGALTDARILAEIFIKMNERWMT